MANLLGEGCGVFIGIFTNDIESGRVGMKDLFLISLWGLRDF